VVPLAEALDLGALGLADRVGDVLERQALVVGIDREDLLEDGLEAVRLALLLGRVLLEVLEIRADLQLDEVRRLDDFAEFAEVNAFGVSAVGHGIFPCRGETKRKERNSVVQERTTGNGAPGREAAGRERTNEKKPKDRPRLDTACLGEGSEVKR